MPSVDVQVDGHIGLSPTLLPSMRSDTFSQLHEESIAAGHAPMLGRTIVGVCLACQTFVGDCYSNLCGPDQMDASATVRFPRLTVPAEDDLASGSTNLQIGSPPELSDEVLLEQASSGSREALSTLFKRYARVVRGLAYRILRDASEADDLLQDIFLVIHRKCGMFDSARGSARFWILQMTYHRAIARRRYLNSRHFYTRVDLDDVERELPARCTGSSMLGNSSDGLLGRQGLQKALEGLSENQRLTLQLFFVQGHTLGEIAVKLNQTRGNVKNHYSRGLEKLRKQIFGDKFRGGSAV